MESCLCLEASGPEASWALWDGTSVVAESSVPGRASGALFASLARRPWDGHPPARLLIGVGPGSFSGIRVTLAAAQGLARAWNCAVEAARSTHALGHSLAHVSFLGVFADAKRGQLFFTAYEQGRMTRPSRLIPTGDLDLHLSKCTRAVAVGPVAGVPETTSPRAADLLRAWAAGAREPDLKCEPIYLHDAVVPPAVGGSR